jgi:hypothetical protein
MTMNLPTNGAQFLHTSQEQLKADIAAYHTAAYCIIEEHPEMNELAMKAWKMSERDEGDALIILRALLGLNDEDV